MILSSISLLALLGGCAQDLGTLSSVADAYGAQTVQALTPAMGASLALGALAARLCVEVPAGAWSGLQPGDPMPVYEPLAEALGAPVIQAIALDGSVLEATVAPVELAGQADARLLFKVVTPESGAGSSPVVVTATLTSAEGEELGSLAYEVAADCSADWARLSGDASWSIDGVDHSFTLPAPEEGASGVDWPSAVPWLPVAGRVKWTGFLEGEDREVTTLDASEIEAYGTGGTWGATASGGSTAKEAGWEAAVVIELQP